MSPGRMDDLKFTFDPAILEESSLAYCILDRGGRILFINRAMEILFGHAVEDCVGRSISMLSPEPDEAVELVTGALDRGRGTCQGEMNARSRDGRTFPCQVTATRFSGSGPDTTVTLGMFRDISGHVQTLEALKSRSDRLGALASIAARIGVYTDSHRLALEAMEAISRLLPIRAGFLLLLDPESGELRLHEAFNLPRGDRELYHAEPGWDQCLEGHVVREKVAILIPDVSRDDRAVHVAPGSMSLAIIPLLTPERVIGVLSVTTAEPHRLDQSDMEFLFTLGAHLGIYLENARLVEELQKRNSMLLEHNQDLEELLSLISHDLSSPRATIVRFASLLMKKGEKISAEERSRCAETIFRKTRETSERFDDLLTIFRMSFAEEEDAH
ncbi:MAG: PAS domain S-box protein, partial [bacterium]